MPQVMVQTGSGGVDHSVIFLPHFGPVISKYMYLRNNQSAHMFWQLLPAGSFVARHFSQSQHLNSSMMKL